MKKLGLLLILLPFAGCLSADFRITQWKGHEYKKGKWKASGRYEMENTGTLSIAYYEGYFEVTCEDGKRYREDHWGPVEYLPDGGWTLASPIAPGQTYVEGFFWVRTYSSKPVSVKLKCLIQHYPP